MKRIKTAEGHASALTRLEDIMIADPEPGSPGAVELDLLAFQIEEYENRTIQIPAPTPEEAVRFRREQGNPARNPYTMRT